jgi:hypothetical protein
VALTLVLALFIAVVYGLYRSPLGNDYRDSVALQRDRERGLHIARLGDEALKPVLESPEFQKRIEGMNADQVRELSMQLAMQGQVRLSDEQLVRRTQLLGEAIDRSPEAECAAALGAMSPAQLARLLSALPDASLREWWQLSAEAMLATLRDAPARSLDPAEVQRAREALLQAMSEPDRERVAAALANPGQLDVAGACWTSRMLYRTASKLPPDDAARVARVLAVN